MLHQNARQEIKDKIYTKKVKSIHSNILYVDAVMTPADVGKYEIIC